MNYVGAMGSLPPSINELRLQEDSRQFDQSNGMNAFSMMMQLAMRNRDSSREDDYRRRMMEEDKKRYHQGRLDAITQRGFDQMNAATPSAMDMAKMHQMAIAQNTAANTPGPLDIAKMYSEAATPNVNPSNYGHPGQLQSARNPGLSRALGAQLGIAGPNTQLGAQSDYRAKGELLQSLAGPGSTPENGGQAPPGMLRGGSRPEVTGQMMAALNGGGGQSAPGGATGQEWADAQGRSGMMEMAGGAQPPPPNSQMGQQGIPSALLRILASQFFPAANAQF